MLHHESPDKKHLYVIIAYLLVALNFVIDSIIPLGVAGGVPYILPVLVSLWAKSEKVTITIALVCTTLTLVGLLSSPAGGEAWKVYFNRGLAVFAIWTSAILTIQYVRKIEQIHQHENEKLLIYNETMAGVNHLLRNLQNNFQVINTSESIKEEFGDDMMHLLNESSAEVENIISRLSKLEDVSVENIQEIAYSNVKEKPAKTGILKVLTQKIK